MKTALTILALWVAIDLTLLVYYLTASFGDKRAERLGNWGGWMLIGKFLVIILGLILAKIWN